MKKLYSLLIIGVITTSTLSLNGREAHSGTCCNEEDASCHFKYQGEWTYTHDQYFKAADETGTAKCNEIETPTFL
ncbi:MAG: hypothetical protein HWE39_24185 [Oceanospirillaceae bacterium]|nr:hypothetical protein [Oceanospirillaceae bacterium]